MGLHRSYEGGVIQVLFNWQSTAVVNETPDAKAIVPRQFFLEAVEALEQAITTD